MATQRKKIITVEQYLAIEKEAESKHEYLAGEIFAMAGASVNHVRIASDTGTLIGNQFKTHHFEVFNSDLRVRTGPEGLYTYPDLSIVCGKPETDRETLVNPTVIIEILSPDSESYDRGEKFIQYQRIPTLRLYVLISQNMPRIETYERNLEGKWSYSLTEGLDASVTFAAIGVEFRLSEVYARVSFESNDEYTDE